MEANGRDEETFDHHHLTFFANPEAAVNQKQ